MARATPFRTFSHADGRQWAIRATGKAVELRITSDGETFERTRTFDTPGLATDDLALAVREQLAEGFTETTPADWKQRVDELVALWAVDDPGFDAEVLSTQFLAAGDALVSETMNQLTSWETGQPQDPAVARAWLKEHLDAVLPGILLALRYPDQQVLLRVDSLLEELPRPECIEALLSIVEYPTANVAEHLGGRASHMPLGALKALGKPGPDTVPRLSAALGSEDFRTRDLAASLLAEFADDEALLGLLYKRRVIARESDGMCWAMLRAAEVSHAFVLRDFLRWMQKSTRFRTPGYHERIGDALAHLRNQ